jgi:hypothetical protein
VSLAGVVLWAVLCLVFVGSCSSCGNRSAGFGRALRNSTFLTDDLDRLLAWIR